MTTQAPKGLVKYETPTGAVSLSPTTVRQYLVAGSGEVSQQEVMMFMALCRYQRLNPFLREAYLIKYGNQPATICVGKETFTKRAAAHPQGDGYKAGIVVQMDDGRLVYREGSMVVPGEKLVGGWAEVYRKDQKQPMRAEVSYDEYEGRKKDGTPNRQWYSKPGTMIRKVALVQALREAYPDALGGLYDAAEMGVDSDTLDTKPIEREILDRVQEQASYDHDHEQPPVAHEPRRDEIPPDYERDREPARPAPREDAAPPVESTRQRLITRWRDLLHRNPGLCDEVAGPSFDPNRATEHVLQDLLITVEERLGMQGS